MGNAIRNNSTANAQGNFPEHALVANVSLPVNALIVVVVVLIIATGSGYF